MKRKRFSIERIIAVLKQAELDPIRTPPARVELDSAQLAAAASRHVAA